MIQGCVDWQTEGLDEPEAVIAATLDYRTAEDVIERFKTNSGFTFAKSLTIIDADLKERITAWAATEGIEKPDPKKTNA